MVKTNRLGGYTKVSEFLQNGAYFQLCQDTFTSGIQPLQKCFVQMDEFGFFLHWRTQDQEAQLLDCNQIREICNHGYQTKEQKSYALLEGQVKSGPASDRIIIIVCGTDMVNNSTFFLLAEDADTAKNWISGLRLLIHDPAHHNISYRMALKKHWMKLCFLANRNNKIPVKSITRPFSSGRNTKVALQGLKDLGLAATKNDLIDVKDFSFDKFYQLYQKVCPRTDIQQVFNSFNRTDGIFEYIEAGPLAQWMNDHQRDPRLNEILSPMYDTKQARVLIENYEPDKELAKKGRLSLEGFTRYLSSLENSAVYRDRLTVFEDMDQPLCHYSINSSHNTYLNGRQFIGDSSVEMYRQVLLSGCRCIELDCWDGKGENQGEPIITHGKAMCTDINFMDVINAINETAFVTSEYPLILSFENHCSKPQQLKLAKYCEEVFGDKLLKKSLDDYPLEPGSILPSPSALKGKIIIKNKRLKIEEEKVQLERYYRHSEILEEDEDEENQEEDSSSIEEAHPELRCPKPGIVASTTEEQSEYTTDVEESNAETTEILLESSSAVFEDVSENVSAITKVDSVKANGLVRKNEKQVMRKIASAPEVSTIKLSKSKSKKLTPVLTEEDEKELLRNYKYVETSATNIHPVLSSLINYCQSVKFQGFEYAEEQKLSHQMSSFSESAGVGLLKTSAIEFVNYNKRQLSRIYPRGNRVDSSNYMPQVFWNAGCQMVSLNFQTSDLSMQLNQGRFEFNGTCGYLLKPEFMRRDDRTFDPFSESPVDGVIAAHCSIEAISGLFLSDKQIGTYVEVDMYGLPTDTIRKEHRTKLVASNGLNPIYNSQPFVFRKVILPNLALVRFAVHDENGKLLGQRVIPLEALQCGYRYISLRSASGQALDPCVLFCNIVLKSYVPDELSEYVNALADPKKYLSIAEARTTQMRNMGIDEDDLEDGGRLNSKSEFKRSKKSTISDNDRKIHSSFHSSSDPGFDYLSSQGSDKRQNPKVTHRQYLPSTMMNTKDAVDRTPVTIDMLAKDLTYQKMVANQTKEIQRLHGKIQKEQLTLERKHKEKLFNLLVKLEESDKIPSNSFCCFAPKLRTSCVTDENFKSRLNTLPHVDKEKILAQQKSQMDVELSCSNSYNETLTRMTEHHQHEQIEALHKLLETAHEACLERLKNIQEKEMNELKQHQTKSSMLSTRGISLDKSLKRAEKDRRIREMSSSNAKKFYEERNMMSKKHTRQVEKIATAQENETVEITVTIRQHVEDQIQDRCLGIISPSKNEDSTLSRVGSQNNRPDTPCDVIAE